MGDHAPASKILKMIVPGLKLKKEGGEERQSGIQSKLGKWGDQKQEHQQQRTNGLSGFSQGLYCCHQPPCWQVVMWCVSSLSGSGTYLDTVLRPYLQQREFVTMTTTRRIHKRYFKNRRRQRARPLEEAPHPRLCFTTFAVVRPWSSTVHKSA